MTRYPYRKMLIERAYSDERGMLLRKHIHDDYTIPQLDMPDWVLQRFNWRGDESVLDVGSGPGTYLPAMLKRIPATQYTAGDLSVGMLKALRKDHSSEAITTTALDVTALPFRDGSYDVVLANHVLHHVEDLEAAVLEIRRVLKNSRGLLIAATNSEYTMPEFNTLMQRAVRLLRQNPTQEFQDDPHASQFSLESGSVFLARHFKSVARHDIPSAFVFRETRPVVEFIESSRPFYEPLLPDSVYWDDFMTIMADQIRRLVEHFGELVVNKLSGVIIATDEGGFAGQYQQMLNQGSAS